MAVGKDTSTAVVEVSLLMASSAVCPDCFCVPGRLRSGLSALALDTTRYVSHSICCGSASWAYKAGVAVGLVLDSSPW